MLLRCSEYWGHCGEHPLLLAIAVGRKEVFCERACFYLSFLAACDRVAPEQCDAAGVEKYSIFMRLPGIVVRPNLARVTDESVLFLCSPLLSGTLACMKHFLPVYAAISLFMTAAIHAEDSYSVKEADISRDEKRQQAILGVREFRCSYSLPNSPEYVQVIVEVFVGAEMRHRYRSQLALNNGQKTGSVSLAWLAKEREMVTLVDTGHPFSPFAKRQLIDTEDFDEPMDIWFFSKCQKNQGMIPLFGICGQRSLKMGSIAGKFEAPQEFVAACNSARSRFSWVVYLYVQGDNQGGWPVFEDGK